MNKQQLIQILKETTDVYYKHEPSGQESGTYLASLYSKGYKHTSEAPEGYFFNKVDLVLVDVVVDVVKAEDLRNGLKVSLEELYHSEVKALSDDPNYLDLGLGFGISDDNVLRLMAVGEVLGLWDICTARNFGIEGQELVDYTIESHLLGISGYEPKK